MNATLKTNNQTQRTNGFKCQMDIGHADQTPIPIKNATETKLNVSTYEQGPFTSTKWTDGHRKLAKLQQKRITICVAQSIKNNLMVNNNSDTKCQNQNWIGRWAHIIGPVPKTSDILQTCDVSTAGTNWENQNIPKLADPPTKRDIDGEIVEIEWSHFFKIQKGVAIALGMLIATQRKWKRITKLTRVVCGPGQKNAAFRSKMYLADGNIRETNVMEIIAIPEKYEHVTPREWKLHVKTTKIPSWENCMQHIGDTFNWPNVNWQRESDVRVNRPHIMRKPNRPTMAMKNKWYQKNWTNGGACQQINVQTWQWWRMRNTRTVTHTKMQMEQRLQMRTTNWQLPFEIDIWIWWNFKLPLTTNLRSV